jgi:hypothetical protein
LTDEKLTPHFAVERVIVDFIFHVQEGPARGYYVESGILIEDR